MVIAPALEIDGYATIKGQGSACYCLEEALPNDRFKLRCTKTRKRLIRSASDLEYAVPPEHTFHPRIKFREWEHLVFANAKHYRTCWKFDRRMHGANYATFPAAMAEAEKQNGMVAAVTATGRHIPLGKAEWPYWLTVWNELPGVKATTR
jgi:hypothetical protein